MGSVYVDCPERACYLCKKKGHTTATCPFRVSEGGAAITSSSAAGSQRDLSAVLRLLHRETRASRTSSPPPVAYSPPPLWRVSAAVLKLHSRRVTAMEFHPAKSNLIVSGDKKGQLAFWDCEKVSERTVLDQGAVHMWLVTALRFLPQHRDYVFSSAVDGRVCQTCCDTFQHSKVGDLNHGVVWEEGEGGEGPADWRSAYAMEACPSRGVLFVGDDLGRVTLIDPRTQGVQGRMQAAKVKQKLCALGLSSGDPNLLATGGNDHFVRLWDVRQLHAGGGLDGAAPTSTAAANKALAENSLAVLPHPRVVSAVSFSPLTGRKLISTCTDNRLRVWDAVGSGRLSATPDHENVHSHDFNRHLTAFRAVWDPKDPTESVVAIGRYISEDFGGNALHPIDLLDTSSGRLLRAVKDVNVPTITPVVAVHPTRDLIAGGSSRNIYCWEPYSEEEEEEGEAAMTGAAAAAAVRWMPRLLDLGDDGKKGGKKGGFGKKGGDESDDEGPPRKKGKGGGAGAA